MTELRNLTPAKVAAALGASHVPSDKTVAETPTAFEATKSYTLPLICKRSGVTVGSLNVITVAGHMPMIGQWKETMVLHPLFSLSPTALLHFSRNTWFRYCNFSIDEGASEQLVNKQEQTLQIAALAMLHNLTEIRQDIPWLPNFNEVSNHWPSLMAISYWKAYLDSARFRFPHIHISRLEQDFSLKDYLQNCWAVKKTYEKNINEKVELEKLRAAEAASIALRDELAGARPTSNRQLWRWFVANMPKRYSKDLEGWMAEIFFAKGEEIRNFTVKDIDLLEEYFLSECPTGSSVSHAFSEVLASKRRYLQQHFEAFEIIIPQQIVAAKATGDIPVERPIRSNFASLVEFLIADAKWRLAHTDVSKRLKEAAARNEQLSVKTFHRPPTLVIREDDADEDVGDEIEPIDALQQSLDDDAQANSGELEE